jgi:hypothetical protein
MSIIARTSPVGIDQKISIFQSFLYEALGFVDHTSYDRVSLNLKNIGGKVGIVPEHFIGGIDYKEVLFDDTCDVSSFFFRVPEKAPHSGGMETARVAMVFQAQLDKLFPLAPHRFDEELNGMIEKASFDFYGHDTFQLVDTVVGLREVYREFALDHIKYDDMHPFYVVRFEYLVRYVPNDSCE